MEQVEQAIASELMASTNTPAEAIEENAPPTIDYEAKARENGWKPKDLFDGDSEAFVEAEEFIKRAPLIKKLSNQRKQIKELQTTVAGMAKHYHSNIEAAKRKAIAELTADRTQAIEIGDVNKVNAIEQEIHNINQVQAPEVPKATLPTEIEDFISDNSGWWGIDAAMTEEAIALNETYLRNNPGKLKESLIDTARKLSILYPGKIGRKFAPPSRNNPPSVDISSEGSGNSGAFDEKNLTKEEKHMYNQFVKVHKIMTKEEYFESLKEVNKTGRR